MTASRAEPAKSSTIADLPSTLELRVLTRAGPRRTWVSPSHVTRTSQVALVQFDDVDVASRAPPAGGWAVRAGGWVVDGDVLAGAGGRDDPPQPTTLTAASAPAARAARARTLT